MTILKVLMNNTPQKPACIKKNNNTNNTKHLNKPHHLQYTSKTLKKQFFERIKYIDSDTTYYNKIEVWNDLYILTKRIHDINKKIGI